MWCGEEPLYPDCHCEEWGRAVRDDRVLFVFLLFEGAQAVLSWITILRKRAAYRKAFDHFDPRKVARYTPARVKKLLGNAGIVRNRLKIASSVSNAKAFLAVQQEFGSFSKYLWGFVDGKPLVNRPRPGTILASTPLSDRISKDLKRRGFRFVGSTITYAYLQAVGVVDDHVRGCFRAAAA
mgnify:CR=1 FL=1